jgi:fructose 1,6-bisphosphate aldolase/phosphatase
MADKTGPGAWNLPLFKIFADPFNTAGLVIDSGLHAGFTFEILGVVANEITDYMRRHGPFMPHRLGPEEMEYTTLPQVLEKLKTRFKK